MGVQHLYTSSISQQPTQDLLIEFQLHSFSAEKYAIVDLPICVVC